MTTLDLLARMRDAGIELWVEDGSKLRFRAAKGALTEEIKGELRAQKSEIIQTLLQFASITADDQKLIPAAPADVDLPLSYAQERLWIIEQMQPGLAVFLMPDGLRLQGGFSFTALTAAMGAMIQRHEVLRTGFVQRGGRPILRRVARPRWRPGAIDLSGLDDMRRLGEAVRIAERAAVWPFDLGHPPLLRVLVLKLAPKDHILLFNFHHIISDDWSHGIFEREWRYLYNRYAEGRQAALPPLPIQYSDFAYWQRQRLPESELEKQIGFWQRKLDGLQPVAFPTDRPRPSQQTFAGSSLGFRFGADVSVAVHELARTEGVTFYMFMLALTQTLLFRYSGQTDLVVGSSIGNRDRPELEGIMGIFVNLLAMRSDLGGKPSFRELLRRAKQTALEAYQHGEVPFEKVVEACQTTRDLSRHPLFQILLTVISAPQNQAADLAPATNSGSQPSSLAAGMPDSVQGTGAAFAEPVIQPFGWGSGEVSRVDFSLSFGDMPEGIDGGIEYNTDLFDRATMERLAGHLSVLLESALRDPDRAIGELAMMTPSEAQTLRDWTAIRANHKSQALLHRLFEGQAALRPEAPALHLDDAEMTYGELNRRANQLAHHLIARGIRPGAPVALCLERSMDMLVAILAVLKAGGSYVPLDPAHPVERLVFIMADSRAPVLITESGMAAQLPECDAHVIRLDADGALLTGFGVGNPDLDLDPSLPAYIIYTSGSTGQPKGVPVGHDRVVRLFSATDAWFHFDETDTWTLFHSYAFDFSVWEIWGALIHGGKLVIVPYAVSRSPELFLIMLRELAVTVLNQTPSAFNQLVQAETALGDPRQTALRFVIFGGETLVPRNLKPWLLRHGDAAPQLVNMYGITETTVHVTYHRVTMAEADSAANRVGVPIPDLSVHILDAAGSALPVGIAGEIFVGGAGLALGYLGKPELTAQRFLPDASAPRPGARLYRSGDLARFLADGSIEHLGRVDLQVKIRGFRIELGEIESRLKQHPSVADAVVVARGPDAENKKLVAYLVVGKGAAIESGESGERARVSEWRRFLEAYLPVYMVPAQFVCMDAIPLTPNGKVDLRALPEPAEPDTQGEGFVEPASATEEVLAAIWAYYLGRTRIGAHDNFFQLGGHSLLATQAVLRLREAFEIELPIMALFETEDLRELADRIDSLRAESRGLRVPPIEPAPRDEELPLSFAQERLWFLEQMQPGQATYSIPMALRMVGSLDREAMVRALGEMVRRHESLRTRFGGRAERPVQIIEPAGEAPLEFVDLSEHTAAQRESHAQALIAAAAAAPFALDRGPLFRIHLVRLAEAEHILLFNFHHIIFDGWSLKIFLGEWVALYTAFLDGKPSPLPAPILQYADFAVWQKRWLGDRAMAEQLAYWRDQLAGSPAYIDLPLDKRRPPVQTFNGRDFGFDWGDELAASVARVSRDHAVTPFMTLMAAFAVMLSRYANQKDLNIGTPIANRNRSEIEGMIGFFVNTLVFRMDLCDPAGGRLTFADLLARVRKTAFGAYAHQDVPFEKIVEILQPERDLSRSPLFQVSFSLEAGEAGSDPAVDPAAPGSPPEPGGGGLPGLRVSPLTQESTTAKFDLTLALTLAKGKIGGGFEYNSDLFEPATIARMADHLRNLLGQISQFPDWPITHLAMVDDAERRDLLFTWNERLPGPMPGSGVHHRFEAWAARTPDAVAVEMDGELMTYAQLNRRANRLAAYLRQRGLGAEDIVALCADPSAERLIGVLGILKAGAGFLPIDPKYPAGRIAYMIEDSGAKLILTWGEPSRPEPTLLEPTRLEPTRQKYGATPIFALDGGLGELAALPDANLDLRIHDGQLAVMLYTSGTTGRPKGVALTHANLDRLAAGVDGFKAEPGEGVAQIASIAFDAFIYELWTAFANGARLCPIRRETLLDADAFTAELRDRHIKHALITTALFNQLSRLRPDFLNGMECVLFGGEKAELAAIRAILEGGPPARLFNAYGPTEATTYATAFAARLLASDAASVPIGHALPGCTVLLLDAQLNPVAVDVPGELHIGGAGVGRGYHQRPGLTAQRFIPNPYPREGEGGSRLYKTGDLARFRSDGSLEFRGRADRQVKLRGFRIELGEIESFLRESQSVGDAVVRMLEVAPGDNRLIAYLLPEPGADAPPDREKARQYLVERVPSYMMPTAFLVLASLPLTPNCKLDERALPLPERRDLDSDQGPMLALTPTEEMLAAIWSGVLGRETVAAGDHFFESGGHSLLATQIVSRVREAFGVDIGIKALFESPVLRDLARRIEDAVRLSQGMVEPPITPVARSQAGQYMLSFGQERLWFLDRLEPGSATYHIPLTFRLRGDLDRAALQRAFDAIVTRHESLRTRFPAHAGLPVQVADGATTADFTLHDWVDRDPQSQAVDLPIQLQSAVTRPFNLAEGPIMRVTLFALSSSDHVLAIVMHHIVSDGWSMKVLLFELATYYRAFLRGESASLPALPVQYLDFAVWQRGWLRGEVLQRQLDFWRNQLAGAPPHIELPIDFPRPSVQTSAGAYYDFQIPDTTAAAALEAFRMAGVSNYMGLLTVFGILLARYSGQKDILIGTPVANRNRAAIEGLIGFFVNTLVMRVDLRGDGDFASALARVRRMALDAFTHQDLPFEQIVESLQPVRDLSRSPLFQVFFSVENNSGGASESGASDGAGGLLSGLDLAPEGADHPTAKFELSLYLTVTDGRIAGGFEYNTDLFRPETVARYGEHFQRLLQSLTANRTGRISAAEMLSEEECTRLTRTWNRTAMPYAAERCIHQWFEQRVQIVPDSIALIDGTREISYGGLNKLSNQLARLLREQGVEHETPVGICLERSAAMVVAMLAVLKAGGTYVPLDPAYPVERITFSLEDARVPLLITDRAVKDSLPKGDARFLFLDEVLTQLGDRDGSDLGIYPAGLSMAYVLFTSGSTGRPKGVAIPHRSVSALLSWAVTEYGPARLGSVLAATSICFDLSIFEIFLPLSVGGRVVLAANALALAERPDAFAEIGLINTVPSAIGELLGRDAIPATVHTVNLAGEPLRGELVRALYRLPHVERVYNLYGPSEDTTYSTFTLVPRDADREPSIGKPLANSRVFLLDSGFRLVPEGCPGELCLAGDGLARGYLGRPAQTAERFVPDPFAIESGGRLYRTGDRARYRDDGTLEFMGRLDFQVKIRGFRIELGEIESVLRRHRAVRDAAVLAREAITGEAGRRLVAYVVAHREAEGGAGSDLEAALRDHLKGDLPDYMMPAFFVFLDVFPLTPNGKLDRKALPEPQAGEREFAAPVTQTERALAELWVALLGVIRVGREDNFFQLGGHSLLANQLAARINMIFGTELPLRDIFAHPVLADLARRVADAGREQLRRLPPLKKALRDVPLPLSYAQERLWFLERLDPGTSAYSIPMALHLTGSLDRQTLRLSLDAVLRRHEALRTRFALEGDRPVQIIDAPRPCPFEVFDFTSLPEPDREAAARARLAAEAARPFEIETGPPIRVSLMAMASDAHFLLINVHHIVFDGWSADLLLGELFAFYRGFAEGQPSPLPDLDLHFADYAAWQRSWLKDDLLDRQLAYWETRLAGAPALLALPADFPRPAVQRFEGAAHSFSLPAETAWSILRFSREQGVTPFMTILAVYFALLKRYTHQSDVTVGTPITNRAQAETEAMIGFFVNTLVMRGDVSGDPTFLALLERVRDGALDAYAHQDAPFEQIVDRLQPERNRSQSPLFQTTLTVDTLAAGSAGSGAGSGSDTHPEAAAAPADGTAIGLVVAPADYDHHSAKFDLLVSISIGEEGLHGSFTYATSLFRPETVARMASHFQTLLQSLIANPRLALSRITMLEPVERQMLVGGFNETGIDYGDSRWIHRHFEVQAAISPDRPALRFDDRVLGYGAMNHLANRLAHDLIAHGVGPEVPVALCMQRSIEMVVALFAILKAGGAYVPLDPEHPGERLAYMLADSGAPVLLTQSQFLDRLPPVAARVLALDQHLDSLADRSDCNPDPALHADSAAYMIYTSGSTGQPKLTLNTHGAIRNRLLWMQDAFALTEEDVVLQKTPYTFDVSVWEFFWPLMFGATLAIARPEGHKDPVYLSELIEKANVTTLHFVPSMLQIFLEAGDPARCRGLRRVICSGEALPRELVTRFQKALPAELHNLYGPTEAAVDVTWHACAGVQVHATVPIGKPIANTRIYILDAGWEPAPIGVPGELMIGGVQLARGYSGRPDLTAERFVPAPLGETSGGRLYRSGDLARWLPDGEIEFLGRIDHQVKIRGFRVELGEIAAVLNRHPAVLQAEIATFEPTAGDKRLAAYVIPDRRIAQPLWQWLHLERTGELAGLPRHELPNGLVVVHQNQSETEFLYQEIYEDLSYLRGGIRIEPGDVIFDVGANIGIFSLFAGERAPGCTVYAFEPIPPIYRAMRLNATISGHRIHAFNLGLADQPRTATFTYYPHVSVLSGQFADVTAERETVKSFLLNQLREERGQDNVTESELEALVDARLAGEKYECRLETLSNIVRQEGVARIDLLKVDVEKGELEVLAGIEDGDWAKIRQIVVEVHDFEGRLAFVTELLRLKGFVFTVDQDRQLVETQLYNIYAHRPEDRTATQAGQSSSAPVVAPTQAGDSSEIAVWHSSRLLGRDLRRFLDGKLPDYMTPESFVFLDEFPLTSSGKVDRKRLPKPARETGASTAEYVAPRTPVEAAIAAEWCDLLKLARASVTQSFFELGGHSLLAVQMTSRVSRRLGKSVPVGVVFKYPTIEALAAFVEGTLAASQSPLLRLAGADHGSPERTLFLVHAVGGQVHQYTALARHLATGRDGGPGFAVYGLHAPGLDDPGLIDNRLDSIAAGYIAAIREVQPNGPYLLGGWSLGGSIAFEMARQLETAGETIDRLILIDAFRLPEEQERLRQSAEFMFNFINELTGESRPERLTWVPALMAVAPSERPARLHAKLVEAQLLPAEIPAAEIETAWRLQVALHEAATGYQPETPLAAPVMLVRAADSITRFAAISQEPNYIQSYGWDAYCRQLTVAETSGDHYTILGEDSAMALARLIAGTST